jgi:16S rRNA (cytidine1402-2'-O)-methyltransferase
MAWLNERSHREQGEYVVVIHPIARVARPVDDETDFSAVDPWVDALLESMSVRDVAKLVSKVTGLGKDVVYARALARSGK